MKIKLVPIETINEKPVFGLVIKPEQYDELIKTIKQEVGDDFLVATKKENDRLKVTFIITAKDPPNKAVLQQKISTIADGFQARSLASSELKPTEVSFPTFKLRGK